MELDRSFLIRYEELMQEDVEQALEFCKDKLEETNNPDIMIYMGECFMAMNDFEGALGAFDEGLNSGCKNLTFAKSLKGEALFYLGDYEESKNIFNELITENPNSFFALAYLTDIDINLGNYNEGVERASEVLKRNSLQDKDAAYIESNIGWIFLKYLNNPDKALIHIKKATELDPLLGTAYIGYGEYYFLKEDYSNALSCYEKALDLGENTIEVYLGLGRCFKFLGQTEDALEYFKIIYQADPENSEIMKEIAILENLM